MSLHWLYCVSCVVFRDRKMQGLAGLHSTVGYTLLCLEPILPKFSTCFTAQPNAIYAKRNFLRAIIIIVPFLSWPCIVDMKHIPAPHPSVSDSATIDSSQEIPTMCRLLSNAINFHILENFCLPLDGTTLLRNCWALVQH